MSVYCSVGYTSFSFADRPYSGYLPTRHRCIDPSAPCVDDDDITVDMIENCYDVDGLGKASERPHPTRMVQASPMLGFARVDDTQTLPCDTPQLRLT